MKFIIGLVVGICLTSAVANAGIISHVVAYKVGQASGKKEAKADCTCPEKEATDAK